MITRSPDRSIGIDLLRLSPALAVTATLWDALQTSLAIAFVLLGAGLVNALLSRGLRAPAGLPARALVVGTFAAAAEMLLDAFAPVFPHPLTGATVAIVAATGFGFGGSRPGGGGSQAPLRAAARLSAFALLGLAPVGALREWLGRGTLLGGEVAGPTGRPPLALMGQPAGGFFAAAVLLTAVALLLRGRSRLVAGSRDTKVRRG